MKAVAVKCFCIALHWKGITLQCFFVSETFPYKETDMEALVRECSSSTNLLQTLDRLGFGTGAIDEFHNDLVMDALEIDNYCIAMLLKAACSNCPRHSASKEDLPAYRQS